MITVKNLVKKYQSGSEQIAVLKDLNFEVQPKEFLAITGRSGSGKSTLLYQLGLLDRPTSGEIFIDGTDVNKLNHDQRSEFRLHKLGYVFQDYALIPVLTALENVTLPLLMQGVNKTRAEKQAKEALDRVGLGDRLNNLPSKLSGGQQQRVSIARAIGHNPKIIFADEPTANLDTESSELILENFIDLNKQGQTIVLVTHEPDFALLADRNITLADGQIANITINKPATAPKRQSNPKKK